MCESFLVTLCRPIQSVVHPSYVTCWVRVTCTAELVFYQSRLLLGRRNDQAIYQSRQEEFMRSTFLALYATGLGSLEGLRVLRTNETRREP